MGERKVLNKYYPPDFDPSLITRTKGGRKDQVKVRMMLPMSIRCNTCGNYIYKGTKFNSRKEDAVGEDYLGIQILRFYFKCPRCSAELAMKTDPKNSDYTLEAGATRNFEPWRDADGAADAALKAREDEEAGNAMKALENRTRDSKREIDIVNALDDVRQLNARHAGVAPAAALAALRRHAEDEAAAFEAAVAAQAAEAFGARGAAAGGGGGGGAGFVRRIEEAEEEAVGEGGGAGEAARGSKRARVVAAEDAAAEGGGAAGAGGGRGAASAASRTTQQHPPPAAGAPSGGSHSAKPRAPVVVVRRKVDGGAAAAAAATGAPPSAPAPPATAAAAAAAAAASPPRPSVGLAGLGAYGSSSDD